MLHNICWKTDFYLGFFSSKPIFFPNRHCQLWSFWFVFCFFVFAFINCKICYREQRFQAKYISALKPGILTHESLEIDLLLQLIPIEHPKICSFLTTLVSFFKSGGFHFSLIRSQSHWSRNQPAAPLKSVVTRVKSVFPDQFPTFSLSVSSCIQNGKPKILWSCDCFGCQHVVMVARCFHGRHKFVHSLSLTTRRWVVTLFEVQNKPKTGSVKTVQALLQQSKRFKRHKFYSLFMVYVAFFFPNVAYSFWVSADKLPFSM